MKTSTWQIGCQLLIFTGLLMGGLACRQSVKPLVELADIEMANKKYKDAIDSLEEALQKWSDKDGNDLRGEIYSKLGNCYAKAKQPEQARDFYHKAIVTSTNTFDAAYALGSLYLQKSDFKEAQQAFEKALEMRPDDAWSLIGLGDSLYKQKKYREAKAYYNQVLDSSPGVRTALVNLRLVSKRLKGS